MTTTVSVFPFLREIGERFIGSFSLSLSHSLSFCLPTLPAPLCFSFLQLPVLIRVPKLICYSVMSVCFMPVSILGFGDIIVPGE